MNLRATSEKLGREGFWLDLAAIQLANQYRNAEYGPESVEDTIPTTEFNFDEVDDTDTDMTPDNVGSMELPSRPLQTMGPI
jgi:hypothetical protein